MDSGPISAEDADINLDNYYLDNQFYNTYVYVHKKLLPKSGINKKLQEDADTYVNNIDENAKQKLQRDDKKISINEMKKMKTSLRDDSIMQQTVKFAKELTPKVIPPSREFSPTPVYYAIKTAKKPGKKIEKLTSSCNGYNVSNKKDKSKNNVKRVDKEVGICSARDVISYSSQNSTLNEVEGNHSSTFSLSEGLESNQHKIAHSQRKRKYVAKEDFNISDSLEDMQANAPAQAEVKSDHINESDKNIFCDSLRHSIITSINEYFSKMQNPTDILSHLQHLSQTLAYNSQKLDFLVQKIDKIEKYVMDCSDKTTKVIMSPKPILSKASKLEELAEDLDEIKEESSIDGEVYHVTNVRNLVTSQSAVVATNPSHKVDNNMLKMRIENLDHGDDVPIHLNTTSTQFGIRSDRPNRVPARFCWTDTTDNS